MIAGRQFLTDMHTHTHTHGAPADGILSADSATAA